MFNYALLGAVCTLVYLAIRYVIGKLVTVSTNAGANDAKIQIATESADRLKRANEIVAREGDDSETEKALSDGKF